MRFDHGSDPGGRPAEYEIRRRRIVDDHWRCVRRRASFVVALSVPALAGILAASFPFLTRTRLMDRSAVVAVCVLGGLLAGVLVCVPKIAVLIRVRYPTDELLTDGLLLTIVLPPLLVGALAGFAAALCVLGLADRESYKPQTLYFLAVALAAVLSRYAAITMSVAKVRWVNESTRRG
jgi:hypothetical protein